MVPQYLLITGKIAQSALGRVIQRIAGLNLEIKPLNRRVASLMTTELIARKLLPEKAACAGKTIIIPGLCRGSLQPIIDVTGSEVLRGPDDLIDLPVYLGAEQRNSRDGQKEIPPSPIKILGEIVNAPEMSLNQIMEQAAYYRDSGADIIDLGGSPERPFPFLKETIRELKAMGFAVSMDSHIKEDLLTASRAGADLVLNLTSHNMEVAEELSCPAVVIPDDGEDLDSLYKNMEALDKLNIPYLADPILPPVTMGLAKAISRYVKVRQDFPEIEILMGIGNVTELIDADSVGINALLVGAAAELRINYLHTTEVSHRTRGAIREVALARQLVNEAMLEGRIPKHLDYSLLTIKDYRGNSFDKDDLAEMQKEVVDRHYRIFVNDKIYLFNSALFLEGNSAEELFSQLKIEDPAHAFYLGRELEKAQTALCLGKRYVQDDPLSWGYYNSKTGKRDKR